MQGASNPLFHIALSPWCIAGFFFVLLLQVLRVSPQSPPPTTAFRYGRISYSPYGTPCPTNDAYLQIFEFEVNGAEAGAVAKHAVHVSRCMHLCACVFQHVHACMCLAGCRQRWGGWFADSGPAAAANRLQPAASSSLGNQARSLGVCRRSI
jgi:hypothetical protein